MAMVGHSPLNSRHDHRWPVLLAGLAGIPSRRNDCACAMVLELGMSTRTVMRKIGIGWKLFSVLAGINLCGSVSQLPIVNGQGGGEADVQTRSITDRTSAWVAGSATTAGRPAAAYLAFIET